MSNMTPIQMSTLVEQINEVMYDSDFGDGKRERTLRKVLYKLGIKSARRDLVMMGLDAQLRKSLKP